MDSFHQQIDRTKAVKNGTDAIIGEFRKTFYLLKINKVQ